MRRHSLIPESAEKLLAEQDAAREKARRTGKGVFNANSFARSIEADLQLALEGKSADVIETAEGPIVVKRLGDKYPVRSRWLKVCAWQRRTFKNSSGFPLFRAQRKPFFFHFNEGGRVLTISIAKRDRSSGLVIGMFRVYLCGLVLCLIREKWSLKWNR